MDKLKHEFEGNKHCFSVSVSSYCRPLSGHPSWYIQYLNIIHKYTYSCIVLHCIALHWSVCVFYFTLLSCVRCVLFFCLLFFSFLTTIYFSKFLFSKLFSCKNPYFPPHIFFGHLFVFVFFLSVQFSPSIIMRCTTDRNTFKLLIIDWMALFANMLIDRIKKNSIKFYRLVYHFCCLA